MNEFYRVLDLDSDCTEEELRRRYLELVRQFPPEKHPEKFSEIHSAYEKLSNPLEHLESELFEIATKDSFEKVLAALDESTEKQRFSTATLLEMGRGK